jgi:hypothetical protein
MILAVLRRHVRSARDPLAQGDHVEGRDPAPVSPLHGHRGDNSNKIIADVNITSDAHGVIFAMGSRFGGHTLFIKDRRLHYVYNFLGIKPEQKFVSDTLEPGKHTLGMAFVRDKSGHFTLGGDRLCVGYDSEDKVSEEYDAPYAFTDGTILGVAVDVGDDVYLDLEKEAAAAMARD